MQAITTIGLDIAKSVFHVGYRGCSGKDMLSLRSSQFDPKQKLGRKLINLLAFG
jgi:hypothetical protein